MTATPLPRLDRHHPGGAPAPPVRLIHLGLGNFHRAHQAWYTAHADDAAGWGIAAFTGRRPDAADDLSPQDGLYTVIIRSADGDAFEIVGSIGAVHPAADHQAYLGYLRRPEVAVVTITLTEAAYLRDGDGHLDRTDPALLDDLDALRADPTATVRTLPARLVAGLAARRDAAAGPVTVLSCDNLPHNGAVTETVVTELADLLDPELAGWITEQVDFASSMVDRITPATTDADRELVADRRHYRDAAPVPTEPFAEWVLSGSFPAGRPDWPSAGARVVDDVTPYEQRKLGLLNGAHSLLAYAAGLRGHATIDQAVGDPECRDWVEAWWDEATRHLTLPDADTAAYRAALLERFANPRVAHQLAQIAADGSLKLPVRIAPTLRAERAAGREPVGGATAVAGWIWHLRGFGVPVKDPGADGARTAARGDDAVRAVLALLDQDLAADETLVDLVRRRVDALDPR